MIEKYISQKQNDIKPDETKTLISNEAYAICDFLDKLINKLNVVSGLNG